MTDYRIMRAAFWIVCALAGLLLADAVRLRATPPSVVIIRQECPPAPYPQDPTAYPRTFPNSAWATHRSGAYNDR